MPLNAQSSLLHLRQIWVGVGSFKSIQFFFFFSLPLSGRSPDMTEILLTETLILRMKCQWWGLNPHPDMLIAPECKAS